MKTNEIKEGNKLIAEFMGLKPVKTFGKYSISQDHCVCSEETEEKAMCGFASIAKYNSSWDWLMPVVGKIEQVTLPDHPEGFGMRIQGLDVIVMDNEDLEWISENAPQMSNKIECAYIHVIEFIKWYNENK